MISAIPLALLLAPGCLEISDARITAGHLKSIVAEFGPIHDGVEFGYAPAPGATRWIRRAELNSFAARHGIETGTGPELCITRTAQTLTRESAEAAIRRALRRLPLSAEVTVEVIDYIRLPLPKGELAFAPRDLHATSEGAQLWRGRVEFDRNRSVPVWVKAKILVARSSPHAKRDIPRGHFLQEEDVARVSALVPLIEALDSGEAIPVAGMEASRDIPAGQRLTPNLLARPRAVRNGEAVRAVSEAGGVRLTVSARATRPGRIGDVIPIENLSNQRILRAVVTAPGQVRILPEGSGNESDSRRGVAARAKPEGRQRQETATKHPSGGAP